MSNEVTAETPTEQPNQLLQSAVKKSATVKLDQVTIRDIELVVVRKKLAETEIQLAKVSLQDALQRQKQVQIDEAAMLAALEQKVGQKITGPIQLLDIETDDTAQVRKQCLEWVEVQQAIERFPDEPIIQYHWPEERVQVLYARGSDAVQKFYQMSDGVKPSSKQKRFESKTIQGEMKKIADEVEKTLPAKSVVVPVEEPKLGWLRGEIQILKAAILGHKPEPLNLTINNNPDEQKIGNVVEELRSDMDNRMKEYIQSGLADIRKKIDEIQIIVNVPEQPAPIVTVNVPPAQITVNVPEQKPITQAAPQVNITMPKVKSEEQEVIRNADGQIESTVTKIEYEE